MAAACTAAKADEPEARPNELPGWGRVQDPSGDCDVSLDRAQERLRIRVPGTPHVLSAEVSQLPMNAPRVVRPIRGDFTADVHVLGYFDPGPTRTTHYDPYHGAGLIVWQDPSNYLRLETAVGFINGRYRPYINYELRENGQLAMTRGITIESGPLYLKLRRNGVAFSAWYSRDGRRWSALRGVHVTFAERVEVGVVAVSSSGEAMSAELEMLNVEDPQGSQARDDTGHDSQGASPPPPAPSPPHSASSEGPQVRPRRMSVLFDRAPKRKPSVEQPAPITTGRPGFQW
jgi:regulation of enolase protein 1 (concanavalin A-like superfamily)